MLRVKTTFLAVLVAVSVNVSAEPKNKVVPEIAAPGNAADQIADINERIALLSAQLAQLEVQLNLAKKKDELSKLVNGTNDFSDTSFLPSIQEIDGVDGKLRALVNLQGGKTQSIRVGDKVNGWTVKKIKTDSVLLQNGKEAVQIGFGGSALNEVK